MVESANLSAIADVTASLIRSPVVDPRLGHDSIPSLAGLRHRGCYLASPGTTEPIAESPWVEVLPPIVRRLIWNMTVWLNFAVAL